MTIVERVVGRTLFRLLLTVGLLTGVAVVDAVAAGSAHGCTCMPMTAEEMVQRGPVLVTVGTATSESDVAGGQGIVYQFEVDRSYGGELPGQITIVTPAGGGACGYLLEVGREQSVVLGHGGGPPLDTGGGPRLDTGGGPRLDTGGGPRLDTGGGPPLDTGDGQWRAGLCTNIVDHDELIALSGPATSPVEPAAEASGASLKTWVAVGVVSGTGLVVAVWVVAGSKTFRRYR